MSQCIFRDRRVDFHRSLLERQIVSLSAPTKEKPFEIASNADTGNKVSISWANRVAQLLSENTNTPLVTRTKKKGQTLGNDFEQACAEFIEATFRELRHLRPGNWEIYQVKSRSGLFIGEFDQYSHLAELGELANKNVELRTFLGEGYTISPDVIVSRLPEPEEVINLSAKIVDDDIAQKAMLRAVNHSDVLKPKQLMHASISCKFTMRSDRAQNTRTEALNLIRGRKGRSPHIVAVTAEPLPSRISSLALGTGDLDCVYHFALYELMDAISESDHDDAKELMDIMIEGKRLKDISDLPLDLAI